jgi:hypothetical protein
MRVAVPTLKIILRGLVLLALVMPISAQAAEGGTCLADLPGQVDAGVDWRQVMRIKDDADDFWQRAIITNPKDTMLVTEGDKNVIEGTAERGTKIQLYFFMPTYDTDGTLLAPGDGVCVDLGFADLSGYFKFEIDPTVLYPNIGEELIFDAFFLTDRAGMPPSATAKNYAIGTHLPLRQVTLTSRFENAPPVPGTPNPPEPPPAQNHPPSVPTAPPPPTSGGGTSGGGTSGGGSGGGSSSGSSGTTYDQIDNSVPQELCTPPPKWVNLKKANIMNPAALPANLRGNNFDAIGNDVIGIARTAENGRTRTFFAGLRNGTDGITHADIAPVVAKMLMTEQLKRALLGDPRVGGQAPGVSSMKAHELDAALLDNSRASDTTKAYANAIFTLMTGTAAERVNAANSLRDITVAVVEGRTGKKFYENIYPYYLKEAQFFLDLFPQDASTPERWADDLLTIFHFYTGGVEVQLDVMRYDQDVYYKNYSLYHWMPDKFASANSGALCPPEFGRLKVVMGQSPRILLHNTNFKRLIPDFTEIKVTYSDRMFDQINGWSATLADTEALYYEYEARQPFDFSYTHEFCARNADVDQLASHFQSELGLLDTERQVIIDELKNQLSASETHYLLRLADFTDIKQRFRWKGDDTPLSIYQLFFEATPAACSELSLPAVNVEMPNPNRDGFEVGMTNR